MKAVIGMKRRPHFFERQTCDHLEEREWYLEYRYAQLGSRGQLNRFFTELVFEGLRRFWPFL